MTDKEVGPLGHLFNQVILNLKVGRRSGCFHNTYIDLEFKWSNFLKLQASILF